MMRPFSDLSEGKDWFISWLKKHHFVDIVDTDMISQYYHWDIEAKLNGHKYVFELKNRTFPSYQFNDTTINKYKYEYLKDSGYISILVTFWDDVWCMIDVNHRQPDEFITRECHRQTRFSDKRLYDNQMARWNIRNMKLLDYDQI